MTDSPRRRQGFQLAGGHARQVPAESHEGTPKDFLRRHGTESRESAHDKSRREKLLRKLCVRVADSRNLKLALDHIAKNGNRYLRSLDPVDIWALVRTIKKAILNGSYSCGPLRRVSRPKSSGKGTRMLSIAEPIDRVVERAVVQILQPILETRFLESSMGYRPGVGRQDALARAEFLASSGNRWILAVEDLKDAFDRVPQCRLIDIIRMHFPDEWMVKFIEKLVLTQSGKGLKQGGPLSSLLLNLYAHHFIDEPWRIQCPDVPLIRVADDLLILGRTPVETARARECLSQLVSNAGMTLKVTEHSPIQNLLTGHTVNWLGYRLGKNKSRLQVDLSERAWDSLSKKFEGCHVQPDPSLRAYEVVRGWAAQLGPVLSKDNDRQIYARIREVAAHYGFEELPDEKQFQTWCNGAVDRWQRCRRKIYSSTSVSRGSARAKVQRADFGPPPGPASERDVRPGTFSSQTFQLIALGECSIEGGVGTWRYIVLDENGNRFAERSDVSVKTIQERMYLMALLRGLEVIPPGSRVRFHDCPDEILQWIREFHACESDDVTAPTRPRIPQTGAADLWRRLADELCHYELLLD